MKTAVIGLGNIGTVVARLLADGGVPVIVAGHTLAGAENVATELGHGVRAKSVAEGIKAADVVIMGVWFETIKELLLTYRDALSGKIVVDPSNPLARDGKGGFRKTLPADESSGQVLASLMPRGAKLVKAFGTLAAETLAKNANRLPERAVLFYATDSSEAAGAIDSLITTGGYVPKSVGGIDQSIRIEAFGDLHEIGKLGRLVSAEEADALLRAEAG
jgi:8-hydroxy-5-deazaflavin:NADPH oxidoreductase